LATLVLVGVPVVADGAPVFLAAGEGVAPSMPSLRLTWPNRTCRVGHYELDAHMQEVVDAFKTTYLCDLCTLETLLTRDGVPVNVCLVLCVLDNGKEEHGLGSRGLLLGLFVTHG
jgi:hypothetical protein